jgi:hypothetical protein
MAAKKLQKYLILLYMCYTWKGRCQSPVLLLVQGYARVNCYILTLSIHAGLTSIDLPLGQGGSGLPLVQVCRCHVLFFPGTLGLSVSCFMGQPLGPEVHLIRQGPILSLFQVRQGPPITLVKVCPRPMHLYLLPMYCMSWTVLPLVKVCQGPMNSLFTPVWYKETPDQKRYALVMLLISGF